MYRQIAVGDSVLFIPYPSTATRPRANATIDEPWLVVDKLPRNRSGILVASRRGRTSERWDHVRDSILRAGSDTDGDVLDAAGRAGPFALFDDQDIGA